jgi:hypothetical protein
MIELYVHPFLHKGSDALNAIPQSILFYYQKKIELSIYIRNKR